MKRNQWGLAVMMLLAVGASADGTAPAVKESTAAEASSTAGAAESGSSDSRKLGERLVYAVERTPEAPFNTARAVEVITFDEIERRAGMSLFDLLQNKAGIYLARNGAPGGSAVVRGLAGKQVLILMDGVKVNNAAWRDSAREYLALIDINQIERVELVRGVVSVLGTESLGGVINIITRKGPAGSQLFSGSIGARYASGSSRLQTPVEVAIGSERFRINAGATYLTSGDVRPGGGGAAQTGTHDSRAAHVNGQYFVSAEKTLSFGHQWYELRDAAYVTPATLLSLGAGPADLALSWLSYQDLQPHGPIDSLKVTAYANRQSERTEVSVRFPTLDVQSDESDTLYGGNIELGSFFGSHHLLYGIDYSTERLSTGSTVYDRTRQSSSPDRGDLMDGSGYRTAGIYVNDHFDMTKWVTASAGVRYGVFSSSGDELLGAEPLSLESSKSDVTSSASLMFHATPNLNVMVNAMRGFRAPNLDDISRAGHGRAGFEVPNAAAEAERVMSYEGGLKYQSSRWSASAFYFRNALTNLLVRVPSTLNGLPYFDQNGNGRRDPSERPVIKNQNVGRGVITGFETEASLNLSPALMLFGNYTKTRGTDTINNVPFAGIPPAFGTLGGHWLTTRPFLPWAEVTYGFASRQDRISPVEAATLPAGGTPAYGVWNIRGGATLAERVRLTVGIENLLNETYRYHGSDILEPGRQVVVSTQYRF